MFSLYDTLLSLFWMLLGDVSYSNADVIGKHFSVLILARKEL